MVMDGTFLVMESCFMVMDMAGLNHFFGFWMKNCHFWVIWQLQASGTGFRPDVDPSFRKQTSALLAGLVFSVRLTQPLRIIDWPASLKTTHPALPTWDVAACRQTAAF